MAGSNDDSGCGCILVILLACIAGGGIWEGLAILAVGWLGYLLFLGVSIGIVLAVIKAIAGD